MLFKNLTMMSASTGVRLGAGLITFALLARLLGPELFGSFMLIMSIGVLISMVTNYGFTIYVLKECSQNSQFTRKILNEVFTGKVVISFVTILIVFIVLSIANSGLMYAFMLVFVGLIFEGFTEFFNSGLRVLGLYKEETKIATISSVIYCIVVGAVVFLIPTIFAAALSFFLVRLFVAILTFRALSVHFEVLSLTTLAAAVIRLKSAFIYAIDFFLQSPFGQVDSIVINHFVGYSSVGLYQAGMRLFMGASQTAPVLANVFLPNVARNVDNIIKFSKEVRYLQLGFLIVGAFIGLLFSHFPNYIVNILYGSQYQKLISLLPWFGVLFFVRFNASAWGLVLTAVGQQKYRTYANMAHWICVFIASYSLVPLYAVEGWIFSLILGNFLLVIIYAIKGCKFVYNCKYTFFWAVLLGALFFIK